SCSSSMPLPSADPQLTTQIAPALHLVHPALAQQLTYRRCLLPAMLEQQPAARREMIRGLGDDAADIVQTILTADQRTGRLEAHIAKRQMRIVCGDVGGIGDDHVKTLPVEGAEPVTLQKMCMGQPESLTIAPGQGYRSRHAIDPDQLPPGAFRRQRQGN